MTQQYKNSILIEGDYNFNYLTNLLFLSKQCLIDVFVKKGVDLKTNKKMFKNIRNLCEFLESSIDVFSRLSLQDNEIKCVIHNIEYLDDNTMIRSNLLTDKLSNNVINKNKEVDTKFDEEE